MTSFRHATRPRQMKKQGITSGVARVAGKPGRVFCQGEEDDD